MIPPQHTAAMSATLHDDGCLSTRHLLEAQETFAASPDHDDLWRCLNKRLQAFGISGCLYGADALARPDKEANLILNAISGPWFAEKIRAGLFYCDDYVRTARFERTPVLWSDAGRLADLPPLARQSLGLDYDHKIVTGVTIPMRFHDGLGNSSIGCHAAGMGFAEFDDMWRIHQWSIRAIVRAFDIRLRNRFSHEMFPLTVLERSCLEYLAAGHRPKQIAYRTGRTVRAVRTAIYTACRKLRACNAEHAVAAALVFGLIAP
jgi:DNA-binding CsgD family transcriptional regulator